MTFSKSLFILVLAVFITACKEYSIIGTWARADRKNYFAADTTKSNEGDLIISPDSTFLIKGSGKADTVNTPGWHSGSDIRGTWQRPDKNHIILLDDVAKEYGFTFIYKIIFLDEKNLIIAIAIDGGKNKMKYIRK